MNLKTGLELINVSGAEFARECGLTKAVISDYTLNKCKPKELNAARMNAVFEIFKAAEVKRLAEVIRQYELRQLAVSDFKLDF